MFLSLGSLSGCGRVDPTPADPVADPLENKDPFYQAFLSTRNQPTATGKGILEGRITWDDPLPRENAWLAPLSPLIEKKNTPVEPRPNPYFPKITMGKDGSKGLGGAIVALVDGPNPMEQPWRHGPIRVVLKNNTLGIEQDGNTHAVGLIQKTAASTDSFPLELVSGDYDTIRGRGAAFFASPFLKPGDRSVRQPRRPGIISLSSGVGHYWMQGMVIASSSALITRTDENGAFRIEGIPPGDWKVLCFRPNHLEKARERDGETLETYILHFQDPVQSTFPIHIGADPVSLKISASAANFQIKK